MSKLVRLKPLNPRRGALCRRYMFRGFRFDVELGWYEVSDELALELKPLTQHDSDPEGVALFDIMTREDALAEDAKEKSKIPGKSAADAPRSVDLKRPLRVESDDVVDGGKSDDDGATPPLKMLDPDPEGKELEEGTDTPEDVRRVGLITTDDVAKKPKTRK